MSISRLTCSLILSVFFCTAAQAQYVWLDEKGNKQFSDMPPPKSVPKDKILKAPGAAAKTMSLDEKTVSTPAAPAKLEKPATLASKNEDYNKRRAEQAEKEKKDEQEKQAAADKAKNCANARSYQETLISGVRITHTDKNGERSYLDDTQRQQELTDVKKTLAGC